MEKLGKYVDILSGFPFKSELFLDDATQTPLIKGENLQPSFIDWEKSKYWNSEEYEELSKFHLIENDVVLAMDRPYVPAGLKWAYIKKSDPKSLLVQRVARLRTKDPEILDQVFLRYIISSQLFGRYLDLIVTGVNVPHISGKQIADFKVTLPKIDTQRKIAGILSAYDELIENNKKRIALLETMAEELYKEWFVRFRFPNYENTEFEKGVPSNWEETTLKYIANVTMGQSPSSEFYNDAGVGLPFHQGVGTYGERFPINSTFCSVEGRLAQENDILFSVRAPVGRLNIATTQSIIGRGLCAINSKNGQSDYLFYLLNHTFSKEDIIGNGAIFNSVSKDELLGFKLLKPNDEIVEAFNNQAKTINEAIRNLYDKNENLTEQKNKLLPKLISGKLSVKHLDIQQPPTSAQPTDKE